MFQCLKILIVGGGAGGAQSQIRPPDQNHLLYYGGRSTV
jgi:hypothetical protein